MPVDVMATGGSSPQSTTPLNQSLFPHSDSGQPDHLSSTTTKQLHHEEHSLEHEDWEDFRGYIHAKRRKLQDQFQGLGQTQQSSIFDRVTIYVNGWTQPDADELKRLIHAHGGNYEYHVYSGAGRITHVIASNLPNSKVRNIGGTIVCTPNWIVDSIAANKLLPVHKYQLYSQDGAGQRRLQFGRTHPTLDLGKEGQDELDMAAPDPNLYTTTVSATHLQVTTDSVSMGRSHSPTPAAKPFPLGYSTSKGTDFINEFYTHSRLHYLSTWSTELKQFTSEMLHKVQPKLPKLPPSVSLRAQSKRVVVHIDLDCFFVSVSIQNKPHLKGKPVAVAHAKRPKGKGKQSPGKEPYSDSAAMTLQDNGTLQGDSALESTGSSTAPHVLPKHLQESMSDIASCSYEARKSGIRNGMWVGEALKLCPDLIIVPYEFDNYRQVSQVFYETLLQYSSVLEAVSCDEAYIELTDYIHSTEQAKEIVKALRDEIQAKTGCAGSAGIASNMLLARMSTRIAKPDGQFHLPAESVEDFLSPQKVHDLPGVGYSTTSKLKDMNVEICSQLRALPLAKLQVEFGSKTGQMLYDYVRGVDNRQLRLTSERKSLSADINYGIRFSDVSEAESLINSLAAEVEKRAEEASILAGMITLKLKVRRPEVSKQTRKYLGHGICDNVSRSHSLLDSTRNASEIAKISIRLLMQLKLDVTDIRGVGIQLSKLVTESHRSKPLGADLRTILNKAAATNTRSDGSHTLTMNTPLPNLATQTLDKGLYSSTDQDINDITVQSTVPGPDESFAIDLPPASELDASVLEALPLPLRDRILKSYSSSNPPITQEPLTEMIPMFQPIQDSHLEPRTVSSPLVHIWNESEFLANFRSYLKDWVEHFTKGPEEHDVEKVTEYLLQLSHSNLSVLLAVLKYLRRTITKLGLMEWCSVFNTILCTLQIDIRQHFQGTLAIEEIRI